MLVAGWVQIDGPDHVVMKGHGREAHGQLLLTASKIGPVDQMFKPCSCMPSYVCRNLQPKARS